MARSDLGEEIEQIHDRDLRHPGIAGIFLSLHVLHVDPQQKRERMSFPVH
jgi:hypothetical protein